MDINYITNDIHKNKKEICIVDDTINSLLIQIDYFLNKHENELDIPMHLAA